jgi:hypothetical protein
MLTTMETAAMITMATTTRPRQQYRNNETMTTIP